VKVLDKYETDGAATEIIGRATAQAAPAPTMRAKLRREIESVLGICGTSC